LHQANTRQLQSLKVIATTLRQTHLRVEGNKIIQIKVNPSRNRDPLIIDPTVSPKTTVISNENTKIQTIHFIRKVHQVPNRAVQVMVELRSQVLEGAVLVVGIERAGGRHGWERFGAAY